MAKIGHIQPYKDGWRIFVERRGKKRTEVFRGSRREAEIRAAQIAAEMGVANPYPRMTLEEYWSAIFPTRLSNRGRPRAKTTMAYYASQMERNVLPKIGSELLGELTHEQLAEVIRSSSSPVNTKRTLMAVMRSAYDDGLVPQRPLERRVAVQKKHKAPYFPWTAREAYMGLEALMGYDDALALYAIGGLSGLGMEEALGLRWADVVASPPHFSVLWTYTDVGGHTPWPKNDYRQRKVPVLVMGRGFLLSRKASADPMERVVPMRGDTLYKKWKKALAELGLRYTPPSMLRHASDTIMLGADVGGELNDKLHGRSNPSVTYASYFRPSLEELEEAAQKMASAMSEHTLAQSDVDNLSQGLFW